MKRVYSNTEKKKEKYMKTLKQTRRKNTKTKNENSTYKHTVKSYMENTEASKEKCT